MRVACDVCGWQFTVPPDAHSAGGWICDYCEERAEQASAEEPSDHTFMLEAPADTIRHEMRRRQS